MNAPLLTTPRVEPFFFDAEPGTRFSLYHAPNPHVAPRGAILYVHPFAGELSRTRRMAALQSRAFAALGYAVLQIDLFGCGDSCGEFSAGRWRIWHDDLALAASWLADRDSGPLTLWGLRLGGLLALDAAARLDARRVLLWQPYMSGRACINQFLRLSEQLRDPAPGAPRSTAALRAQLAVHGAIEVGGFEVAVPLGTARGPLAVGGVARWCAARPARVLELIGASASGPSDMGARVREEAEALLVMGVAAGLAGILALLGTHRQSLVFAATFPERTSALVLVGSYARRTWAPDYPWGLDEETQERILLGYEKNWGKKDFGLSSLAMLGTTIWMLAADHWREWKPYQRNFYKVEAWTAESRVNEKETAWFRQQQEKLESSLAEAPAEPPDPAGLSHVLECLRPSILGRPTRLHVG